MLHINIYIHTHTHTHIYIYIYIHTHRFVFLSAINQLYNSLIDTPNPINHPTRKSDILDIYIGLNSFKSKDSDGAKIVHRVRPCIS